MQHALLHCFACVTAQRARARSEMRVTQTPVVRYGPAPNTGKPLPFSYPLTVGASPDTYVQSDLCGDPVRAAACNRQLDLKPLGGRHQPAGLGEIQPAGVNETAEQ